MARPLSVSVGLLRNILVARSAVSSLISPVLGVPALAVPVGNHERLRPGVQILAPRFR